MILTEEESEARLNSPNNLVKILEIGRIGRTNGAEEVPSSIRELAGRLANLGETQKEVGDTFGISHTTVSKASRGLVNDSFDPELKAKVDSGFDARKEAAKESAMNALSATLNSITPEKLAGIEKVKDLARIATDMSKVVSNLEGREREATVNNTQIILMRPPERRENLYETIEA